MPQEENDHDIIIEVRTELRGLRDDVKDIRNNTAMDIAMLKKDKADRAEVYFIQKKLDDDIETRMRKVEICKIEPASHQKLLESTGNNGIFLLLGIGLLLILVGIMSVHIIGIKLP